jgi:hypothetical protein
VPQPLNHLRHRVPQVTLLQFIFQVATHRPYPEDEGRPFVPVDPVVYTLRTAEGPPAVPVKQNTYEASLQRPSCFAVPAALSADSSVRPVQYFCVPNPRRG